MGSSQQARKGPRRWGKKRLLGKTYESPWDSAEGGGTLRVRAQAHGKRKNQPKLSTSENAISKPVALHAI